MSPSACAPSPPRVRWEYGSAIPSTRRREGNPLGPYGARCSTPAGGAPFMHKCGGEKLSLPPGEWIAVGEQGWMGPEGAEGCCGEARWSLRFVTRERELRHLTPSWLYRSPLPRTKLTSPAPAARFEGMLELGEGRSLNLAGWRGMVGHNWGSEHAERWIWLHGIDFEEEPGAWLDVALGRVKIAGRMTPWVANGALR